MLCDSVPSSCGGRENVGEMEATVLSYQDRHIRSLGPGLMALAVCFSVLGKLIQTYEVSMEKKNNGHQHL